MAKSDSLKEEIGWLKVVFALLGAIDASVAGWLAQTQGEVSGLLLTAGAATATVTTFVLVVINYVAYRRMRELERV